MLGPLGLRVTTGRNQLSSTTFRAPLGRALPMQPHRPTVVAPRTTPPKNLRKPSKTTKKRFSRTPQVPGTVSGIDYTSLGLLPVPCRPRALLGTREELGQTNFSRRVNIDSPPYVCLVESSSRYSVGTVKSH